jgi:hypothetical protein
VPTFEESVHFRLRSSALSFDRFANDYAVSKRFAPEPPIICSMKLKGWDGAACRYFSQPEFTTTLLSGFLLR